MQTKSCGGVGGRWEEASCSPGGLGQGQGKRYRGAGLDLANRDGGHWASKGTERGKHSHSGDVPARRRKLSSTPRCYQKSNQGLKRRSGFPPGPRGPRIPVWGHFYSQGPFLQSGDERLTDMIPCTQTHRHICFPCSGLLQYGVGTMGHLESDIFRSCFSWRGRVSGKKVQMREKRIS